LKVYQNENQHNSNITATNGKFIKTLVTLSHEVTKQPTTRKKIELQNTNFKH